MAPLTHYTEQPSRLSASLGAACLRVHGGGFVTREMLEQTLADLRREAQRMLAELPSGIQAGLPSGLPSGLQAGLPSGLQAGLQPGIHAGMLVDLREVAGYESSCLVAVRQFLLEAAGLGLRRIAVVASSSVLRTASRLAAHTVSVELRTFEHELPAAQWLHGPEVVIPRPRTSSSAASAAAV